MVLFLSWRPPSPQRQKACVDACVDASGGAFNYDADYRGASEGAAASDEAEAALVRGGFHVNRARVLLGSGADTFRRAKSALCAWRHFRLGWAFVEEGTPVEKGTQFCVCVKEILPWMAMPLQIAYVADASSGGESAGLASGTGELRRPSGNSKASFSFGSGTLRGHLLAGEERFSVEWDDNDQVFYEIFSFSKPAHMLSAIGYPYVRLRQKHFAQESGRAILKHLASEKPTE